MASMLSQASVYLFPAGGYPAALFSNAEKAADIISEAMAREFPGRTAGMAARVHPTRFIISEAQQEKLLKNMAGRR